MIKTVVATLVIATVGYWLFSDTVRFYSGSSDNKPLRVSFFGSSEEFDIWKQMLASFREKHPDIPVKGEFIPSRYAQKIQQLMVADDAADVILYEDEPLYGMVEAGKFEDLMPYLARRFGPGTDGVRERFWPQAVDAFGRWEGEGQGRAWRQYGIPIWGGCNLIFYNRAAFEESRITVTEHDGPDAIKELPDGSWLLDDDRWTLNDYVRMAQRLTIDRDGDGRTDQFGTAVPIPIYWMPFHWSSGADILTPDKQHTSLYGPASEASFQLYYDLRWKYQVVPTPAELGNLSQNTGFFTGLVATFCYGPWGMPFCNAVADEGLAYDVLHIPRNDKTGYRATRITWDGLAMFSGSRKKEQAWLLIEHLTSRESQQAVARLQRSIPSERVPDDVYERAILQGQPAPGDDRYAAIYFTTFNPDVSTVKFVRAINEYGRLQPITKEWSELSRSWTNSLEGLQRMNPDDRFNAQEAVGRFYADRGESRKLRQALPPADAEQADRYRRLYEESGKP